MAHSNQGGVKNYLGNQKMVKAPLHWQSAPNHPTTELAYITKKEKDLLVKKDLHGSLKGGVNRGPSGIMSLNGWGSTDPGQNVSGAAASAAESGKNTSDTLAAGMSNKDVQDFRSAAINAGAGQRVNPGFFDSRTRLDPDEIARAKAYRNDPANKYAKAAYRNTGQGGLRGFISGGGIFGNLLRGIGQKFGWGKTYDQPTHDMSGLYESDDNPEYYNDLGNQFALSTTSDPFRNSVGPNPIDSERFSISIGNNNYGARGMGNYPHSTPNADWTMNQTKGRIDANNVYPTTLGIYNAPDSITGNYGARIPPGNMRKFKEGGRAGYREGLGPVLDENVDENTLEFMQDQGVPYGEMAEKSPFEMRIDELMDEGMSWQEAYDIASEEFNQLVEGGDETISEEGIASIV